MLRMLVISCLAVGGAVISHPAAAYYGISGTFTANASCPAVTSIRNGTNPGSAMVEPGKTYAVRGLNKEGGTHVDLDIPGASGPARWVDLTCGTLSASASPVPATDKPPVGGTTAFLPFFDTRDDGPNDPTPPPPTLSAFDKAVLDVCGPWGSHPTEASFRQLLDRPDLADDVANIYEALGRSVAGDGPEDLPGFKGRLTQLWFKSAGFVHIFCGEPAGKALGGFHFAARYLQAQEQKWAGLAPADRCNPSQREIVPPIYTLGVSYLDPAGAPKTDCMKGYAYGVDARTILVDATTAMKAMKNASDKQMCLKEVKAPGIDYFAVSVIKNHGVRTFYPDASPSCDGGKPAKACLCRL
ncbi:EndoU domain-containing protein [Azospirillum sp.]|uniref:EndoU domain-containing protein n=1 Tax=Azospirillum sp. TaxID=34012 RepID=UPI002D531210|nr:EndoU domain-containing protein [Azospirillum sp.]HYD65613.1 EndoU domain-containing protein [Azospirillum sp.]